MEDIKTIEPSIEIQPHNPTPVSLPTDGLNTLYQEKNQTISDGGINAVDFINKISAPIRTNLKGNRILSKIQQALKLSFYDTNSYVPSPYNVNGATGTLTDIRREMINNWVWQEIRIPNSLDRLNKDQIMATYTIDEYNSILIDAPSFKEDFFNECRKSLRTKFALDVLVGGNLTTPQAKTYNASGTTGTTYTVPSFFSLVNSAGVPVDVSTLTPTVLVTSASGIKAFSSSKNKITDQWADFKILITKLKQKNNLTIGGISGYLEEYVIATSISTLENIKTQDYLFYKDIKALQEVGEIVVCPETENDVYPVSSTTTAAVAQNAQVVALPTLNTGWFVLISKGKNALIQPVSNFDTIYADDFYNNSGVITMIGRHRLGYDINANSYIVIFEMNLDLSTNQYNVIDVSAP